VSRVRSERAALARWFDNLYAPDEARRVVWESVGANTFRAFGGMPERPSVVFRAWAHERLIEPSFSGELSGMSERGEYDRWLAAFAQDLSEAWERSMGQERRLSFGHGRKMTNLLMKHIARWSVFDEQTRRRLIGFLHVPFDSFSLSLLRCCLPDRSRPTLRRIPKNVTMGWVDSQSRYDELQILCRDVAAEAGVAPIHLDVLAWNSPR
jgi:hypothetical protein